MRVSTKLLAAFVIVMLLALVVPSMASAKQYSSKANGTSILMDPVGDFVNFVPLPPAYSDIKKGQVTYQVGINKLIFTMNLAEAIPNMTNSDFIIYNWLIDTDMDGTVDLMVTLSWTNVEWSSGVMLPGTSSLLVEVEPQINGSRIQVKIDKDILDDELGYTITEFKWKAHTKFVPGPGISTMWDVIPNTMDVWGYWSSNH